VRARLRDPNRSALQRKPCSSQWRDIFGQATIFLADSPGRHAGRMCHSLPVPLGSGGYPSPPGRSFIRDGCPFAEDCRTRSEAEEIPPPRVCSRSASRSSVVPIARCQEVVHDEISNVIAQSLTGRKVEEKVHPGKDTTHRCFVGRSLEARERATHNLQDL
jgi:hypothetical protein